MTQLYSTGSARLPAGHGEVSGEKIIGEHKPAFLSYLRVLILGAALLPARGLGILLIAGAIMHRNSTGYTVTNRKIKVKTGLWGSIAEIGIPDIEDISLKQNFWSKLFGYGDIYITVAGMDEGRIVIRNTGRPENVLMLMDNLRGRAGYGITRASDAADGKPGKHQKCRREDVKDWRLAGTLIILGIVAFALLLSCFVLILPW